MTEEMNNEQGLPPADFMTFVFTLATHAQVGLGVIPNPLTKKTEVDLKLTQYQINILDMLQEKTKGNLSEEEAKNLEEILHGLRMAFVNVSKQQG